MRQTIREISNRGRGVTGVRKRAKQEGKELDGGRLKVCVWVGVEEAK